MQCQIKLFHFWPLWSTQLTDVSYTDFTVSCRDALDRLGVRLNIILFSIVLPAPQRLVNSSSALVSSNEVNSFSLRSSPLSTISQIFSARRRPTPGRDFAS